MTNEVTNFAQRERQPDAPLVQGWSGFVPRVIEHEDDVWLTAEQIGDALEYDRPNDAITRLYSRHRELLEPYTITVKLTANSPGNPTTRLFNEEGVIPLCLKSSQPKAIAFQRWAAAELKARRRARYMDVATQNAKLEDRVNYLTAKLLELHERHERKTNAARTMSLENAATILRYWQEGYGNGEIAVLAGWSTTMVNTLVHGEHKICRDIERAFPALKTWPVSPDDPRSRIGRPRLARS